MTQPAAITASVQALVAPIGAAFAVFPLRQYIITNYAPVRSYGKCREHSSHGAAGRSSAIWRMYQNGSDPTRASSNLTFEKIDAVVY